MELMLQLAIKQGCWLWWRVPASAPGSHCVFHWKQPTPMDVSHPSQNCYVFGEMHPAFGFTIFQLGWKYESGRTVLLFHQTIRWLPRGRVLRCFSEMGDDLCVFEMGSSTRIHESSVWQGDWSYLCTQMKKQESCWERHDLTAWACVT